MYINDCRKWCKGGQHILDSSFSEIEKEMKISNHLHKKKLRLAIEGEICSLRVDSLTSLRWYVDREINLFILA